MGKLRTANKKRRKVERRALMESRFIIGPGRWKGKFRREMRKLTRGEARRLRDLYRATYPEILEAFGTDLRRIGDEILVSGATFTDSIHRHTAAALGLDFSTVKL